MAKKKTPIKPDSIEQFMIDDMQDAMMRLMMGGITPEIYAQFYSTVNTMSDGLLDAFASGDPDQLKNLVDDGEEMLDDFDDNMMPPFRAPSKPRKPLPDADQKTIRLKIQLSGVKKPPMWREIEMPADSTFERLHEAIQIVTGLEDCHLWQFQDRPYDHGFAISYPYGEGPDGMGIEDCTDNAATTQLTAFLKKPSDRLSYVYDFGDDWIFDVTVKAILHRKTDRVTCTGWKSDLQPMEDMGGVYSYLCMRDAISPDDPHKIIVSDDLAEKLYIDDTDEFSDYVSSCFFDLEIAISKESDLRTDGNGCRAGGRRCRQPGVRSAPKPQA